MLPVAHGPWPVPPLLDGQIARDPWSLPTPSFLPFSMSGDSRHCVLCVLLGSPNLFGTRICFEAGQECHLAVINFSVQVHSH